YAAMQWAISDEMRAVSGILLTIDGYAFWLSVIVGMAGLVYIGSRRTPATLYPAYQQQLRRFILLCTAATGADHIGGQRRRSHRPSIAWNGIVDRLSDPDPVDGDRDRGRRRPCPAHPQHDGAN